MFNSAHKVFLLILIFQFWDMISYWLTKYIFCTFEISKKYSISLRFGYVYHFTEPITLSMRTQVLSYKNGLVHFIIIINLLLFLQIVKVNQIKLISNSEFVVCIALSTMSYILFHSGLLREDIRLRVGDADYLHMKDTS